MSVDGESVGVALAGVIALALLVCCWPPGPRTAKPESETDVYGYGDDCATCRYLDENPNDHKFLAPGNDPSVDCPACSGVIDDRAKDPASWGSE